MVLSYQVVITDRITHNAFVSFNKRGYRMVLSYEVSTKTSLACNKLFLQQRKRGIDIKENPFGIYSQNYTVEYLKQRNIISFYTLHIKLPNIIF